MSKQLKYNSFLFPAIVLIAGIFFSCSNDLDQVKKITTHPDNPDETSEMLHIIYTDSGLAKVEIFARIAETYTHPKSITKFKDGLKVHFFDNQGKIESILTSKYGQIDDESGIIMVRDSVKLVNIEDQRTMETEVLYWKKGGDSIYTNKAVVITTKDMILSGVGAWTTPSFDTAQFFKPTAKIFLKE
ncbi:MAG: LPS export ABC transporter periplasmic protein LptC [Brumimicrobium sp.]|nr:LPS export ABC transporter periplasmic protein LptC [Brumimicrobium sp.]MCO5268568.1 LPS export ABC transporter periplasmic protein LptC [Brumimicrobium sp.]